MFRGSVIQPQKPTTKARFGQPSPVKHTQPISRTAFSQYVGRNSSVEALLRPSSLRTYVTGLQQTATSTQTSIPRPTIDYSKRATAPKVEEKPKKHVKDYLKAISVEQILRTSKRESDSNEVFSIPEDNTVYKAIKMMSDKDTGSILVTDSQGKLVGIFTERDYIRKIFLKGLSSKTTTIRDVMTRNPTCVTPRNTLDDCARLMVTQNMRHLPVLEKENDYSSLAGVLSSKDITEQMVKAANQSEYFEVTGTVSDVFDKVARTSSVGIFVDKDQTVFQGLELMDKNKTGAVLVHDGPKILGIFTERDYLHKIILKRKSSLETPVGEVMTPDVVCVHANTSIRDALKMFAEEGIRHLPILNFAGDELMEERIPMGLISSHNVMKFIYQYK